MTYVLHLAVMLGLYGMLAMSANIAIGDGGLLSLATATFYGIGAYLYAWLSVTAGWSAAAAFPATIAGGALAGGVFALATLRFRNETFTVATMAVQMVAFGVFYNWTDVTGGPYGFPDIARPSLFGFVFESQTSFCAAVLALCLASCVLFRFFSRSRFALALRTLREDELAAASLGIAPNRTFAAALVLSAMLAATAGALFACYVSYVDPTGFAIGESVFILAMLIVGGSGNLKGPIIGAAILLALPEALRFIGLPADVAGPLREIIYGFLLIVLMYLKPKGLAGDYAIR